MIAIWSALAVLLTGSCEFLGVGLRHMVMMQGGGNFLYQFWFYGSSPSYVIWVGCDGSGPINRDLAWHRPPTVANEH